MVMGNPSLSASVPGGTRSGNQPLIVVFDRDESLVGLLIGQLRAQGYEGRSARTPVEVFDLIARYPVRLALVNLGQAATGRREFWVALDAQRFGRGVQVITYRYVVPGVDPDVPDGSSRPDVEVRGPQALGALVDAVRAKIPPPPRETPDSSFLVAKAPGLSAHDQPSPFPPPVPPSFAPQTPPSFAPQAPPVLPPLGKPQEYSARQQGISGILNLSRGAPAGQMPEFMPVSGGAGVPGMPPANGGWMPEANRMPAPPPSAAPLSGVNEPPRAPQRGNGRVEPPGGAAYNPSLPMGDLAAISDAINALAAAGAPGYQQAAAAVHTMQAAPPPRNEPDRWPPGQSYGGPERGAMPGPAASYPAPVAPGLPESRQPSGPMGGVDQTNQGNPPPARGAAETLYMGQKAFAELGRTGEAMPPPDTRSRTVAGTMDEYNYGRRVSSSMPEMGAQQQAAPSRRLMGEAEPMAGRSYPASPQQLAPIVAPGQVERSLGNVLVEGQLVSQQRLEVALGIQRLLRGVDLDYRLGEVLLTFKFLTHDQLLAAVLVSRGLVTPAQVASIGRIKQELHAIGMEYDLENLLILFRMLSSEQLREIRAEFP
jgi:hypothetical protein